MKKKIKLDEFKVTSFVTEIESDEVVDTVKGGWSGHYLHCSRICVPIITVGVICNTLVECETDQFGYCQIP